MKTCRSKFTVVGCVPVTTLHGEGIKRSYPVHIPYPTRTPPKSFQAFTELRYATVARVSRNNYSQLRGDTRLPPVCGEFSICKHRCAPPPIFSSNLTLRNLRKRQSQLSTCHLSRERTNVWEGNHWRICRKINTLPIKIRIQIGGYEGRFIKQQQQ